MTTKLSAKQYEMLEYAEVREGLHYWSGHRGRFNSLVKRGLLAPHADRPSLHILTDAGQVELAQKRNNTDEVLP